LWRCGGFAGFFIPNTLSTGELKMPITKSRLNKIEQGRYLACLKELRAGGCDVEIPSRWLEDSRTLDIIIRRDGSTEVVEGSPGVVVYAVSTRLVARKPYVVLTDCACETEWDDQIVLNSFQQQKSIYRLGRRQYPSWEVLNDRIENSLQFTHQGQVVEGVILFVGIKPIPEHYCLGMSAPFKLTFLDQFADEIEIESELFVNRETKRKTADAHPSSSLHETAERLSVRRSTLFEREDGSNAPPEWAEEEGSFTASTAKDSLEGLGHGRGKSDAGQSQPGSSTFSGVHSPGH
jgi:hypothetical protein